MNLLLDQLCNLLNQEIEFYRSMLTLIGKEKDAVIKSELNALNEVGIEKENILVKLRIVEEQRTRLVTRLAEKWGYPFQDLTLTLVSQRVDEPYADRLKRNSAELLFLIKSVQETNQRNKQLFEHSLELIRGSYNLLNDLMASNTVYRRSGGMQRNNPTGRLVHGEI